MIRTSALPKRIGSQPPFTIFRLFADRKVSAISTKGPSVASDGDDAPVPAASANTMMPSVASTTIVAVTAMP